MVKISKIAQKLKIPKEVLTLYGDYKAKIDYKYKGNKNAKLILVTAINPISSGEGKTTVAIGLSDAINSVGNESLVLLREPSLGPIFGSKGTATGAGESSVVPFDDINLHFTGDIHAITSANNLIAAVIDSHIFNGNKLNIKDVFFKRAIDMNDRSLRKNFVITAASEIMSILTLSHSMRDLKLRINRIIFGINNKGKPLYVEQLNITGSLFVLLKDAINPNIVQTKAGNPAIIHGGPFANVSHGTSSIFALNQAMSLTDYVVTEAGFGADLGAEKFFNIVTRQSKIIPSLVVLVATISTLIKNGNGNLIKGIEHLEKHITNLKNMNINFVVALNKFVEDDKKDIDTLKQWAKEKNVDFEIADVYEKVSANTKRLAKLVIEKSKFFKHPKYTYQIIEGIKTKIESIAKGIYGAKGVNYSKKSLEKIKWLHKNGLDDQYICMAKNPKSFSGNPSLLGTPQNFTIRINDIEIFSGAKLIVAKVGKIVTMPGLQKEMNATKIDLVAKKVKGMK